METRFILLFVYFIHGTSQFELREDNPNNAIIFYPAGNINLYDSTKTLTYFTNISIINEMEKNFNYINTSCPSETRMIEIFKRKLSDMKQMKRDLYKKCPRNAIKSETILFNGFLKEDYEQFKLEQVDQCKMFRKMLSTFLRLNVEIDKIQRRDLITISNTISLDELESNVYNLINQEKTENLLLPFDFSYHFAGDFLDNTNFTLNFDNDLMLMTFSIKLFKQGKLHFVYPKPIIFNTNPYILDTNVEYATFAFDRPLYFTMENIEKLCIEHKSVKFCNTPERNNNCDVEYITFNNYSKHINQCFRQFPKENTAIQIHSDMHFSIIKPLTIDINCGKGEYPIYLTKSTHFANLTGCSLKTNFFKYDSTFDHLPYKMYVSNGLIMDELTQATETIDNQKTIQQIFLALIVVFHIIIIITLILRKIYNMKKRILGDQVTFYVSANDTEV